MTTLGEKLRLAKEAVDRIAEAKRQEALNRVHNETRVRRIRNIAAFDEIQQNVIDQIELGNITLRFKVPHTFYFFQQGRYAGGEDILISDARHSDHDLWKSAMEWYDANELNAVLEYEHDGVGINGWYVMHVTAV